jgi:hypothetical protein
LRRSDKNIGKMLVRVVYEHGPIEGYRKLKTKVESRKYLNRILHTNTYNHWISTLRKYNILTQSPKDKISRSDGKPGGKRRPIDLTDTAKKKYKLGTFIIPGYEEEEDEERVEKLYQLILYFAAAKTGQHEYGEFWANDKQRINECLSRLLLTRCSVDTLEEEELISHKWSSNIIRIIYKSPSSCLLIWKETITAVDDRSKCGILYHVKVLGLSVPDVRIRDRPFFRNINFTIEEIQNVFDRLVELGIMNVIGNIWGVARYDFVDDWLREFITRLWGHHELILNEMYSLYDTKSHPSNERTAWLKDRRKWLGLFQDKIELESRIRNDCFEHRKKEDASAWAELILQDYEELKKRYPDKIKKYEFILDRLLEVIYPPFLRRARRIAEVKHKMHFEKWVRKKHRLS